MELNEYQQQATSLAIYPGQGTVLGLLYAGLKLSGEAGEIAEKLGKALRDDGLVEVLPDEIVRLGTLSPERRQALKLELGDVLWYISALAAELGFTLDDIAAGNLDKLFDRRDRGVLHGSGDNR